MGRNNKHKRGARNKRGPVRSERRPSLTGRVQLHEHSAYVITENGDYKVMGRGKREIMDGGYVPDRRSARCDRAARFALEGRLLHFARGYLGGSSGCPPG